MLNLIHVFVYQVMFPESSPDQILKKVGLLLGENQVRTNASEAVRQIHHILRLLPYLTPFPTAVLSI